MSKLQDPQITIQDAGRMIIVSGPWEVRALAQPGVLSRLQASLRRQPAHPSSTWDLTQMEALDHIGAQWLWELWGKTRPAQLQIAPEHEAVFQRVEQASSLALPAPPRFRFLPALHSAMRLVIDHVIGFVALIGQLMLDLTKLATRPLQGPWKEISSNVFHIGYQALGITALVGFLIGVVLSFLSAQQLQTFGGDIYLVNILGMSIVRELGPLLAAILVAGRSGSAITAQLGVMRVTEELDAMRVMGMPHGFRLIMPKVIALAISMPLLVVWTDAIALIGGMGAALLELDMSPIYFMQGLPDAVPLANYWIGLTKGVVFGILIALVACHYGLRIKANTESLGQGTTLSVVSAITAVILADALFAILFKGVGFY